MLKKMGIKSPLKFMSETQKDMVQLDSCIVSGSVLQSLEASVDECVVGVCASAIMLE